MMHAGRETRSTRIEFVGSPIRADGVCPYEEIPQKPLSFHKFKVYLLQICILIKVSDDMRPIFAIVILFSLLCASAIADDMRLIGVLRGTNSGDQMGFRCEQMGDVNRDGFDDFLVTQKGLGKLQLYFGSDYFDPTPVLEWDNYISLYHPPYNIGDVDGDSVNDFIGFFHYSDTLKLFKGLENLDPDDYLVLLPDSNPGQDSWTYVICGGGDNNNDGRPDFWIARYSGSFNDTIRGYSGLDLLDTIPEFKLIRPTDQDGFFRLFGKGFKSNYDLNGDFIPDIIYGEYDGGDHGPGRVCITWGGASISQTPDLIFHAPDNNSRFAFDIAYPGDISGDGIDDMWVNREGRGYIYYGGQPFDTIADKTVDYTYLNQAEQVGDINHDGWGDIMLVFYGSLYSQIAYIYCGPDMDTLVDLVYHESDFENAVAGPGPVAYLGQCHSWAGDVDGDGIDDVLIGAKWDANPNFDEGWLFIQAGFNGIPTSVDDEYTMPFNLEVRQNYPNPFNPSTTIEFTLPRAGYTEVTIFNLLGEIVAKPLAGQLQAGEHRIQWDGRDVGGHAMSTGVYFYSIVSGDYSATRKMVLLK